MSYHVLSAKLETCTLPLPIPLYCWWGNILPTCLLRIQRCIVLVLLLILVLQDECATSSHCPINQLPRPYLDPSIKGFHFQDGTEYIYWHFQCMPCAHEYPPSGLLHAKVRFSHELVWSGTFCRHAPKYLQLIASLCWASSGIISLDLRPLPSQSH